MTTKRDMRKSDVRACIACVHAANSVSVNIDERTPLISSGSSSGSYNRYNNISRLPSERSQYGSIQSLPRHNQFSWLLVIALFLFFFTGISIATYLLFNEGIVFTPEIYTLIEREAWNASLSDGLLFRISMPADSVILTDTRSEHCDRLTSCVSLIRHIQDQSMTVADQSDVEYNFLIDDQGIVYEGLGWYHSLVKEQRPIIALIGDYRAGTTPNNDQIIALKILLKFAVDRNVLTPCYSLRVAAMDNNNLSLVGVARMLQVEAYQECFVNG